MHKDFQTYNPFRVPQWRYDRVLQLVEHRPRARRPSPKRDDEYVRAYWNFFRKYDRAEEEEDRLALFPNQPAMYYAHLIHHHPDREWRAMIQARLLTRVSDEEIAETAATLPEAIFLYEKLFFHVRDRIDSHDWIVKTVMGTAANRASNRNDSWTDNQRNLAYKLFAYFGGPIVLDVIISGFLSGDFPKNKSQIGPWFDSTMRLLVKRKATMAAQLFEVNKWNVMQLLEIHLQISNAENAAQSGPQTDIEKGINALLQTVPWGLAKRGYDQLTEEQQRYALSPVEPNAMEQMSLASGKVPASLIEITGKQDQKLLTHVEEE